jgi:hemoglobin-like flavoprotein
MTETMTEVMMIRYSFGLLAERADRAVPMFFGRLFELAPRVRLLFPGEMAQHQMKFTMMLVWLVERVDKPAELVPALRELGARHQRYGVTSEMFEPAWAALIYTFRKVLGDEFTLEMEACWMRVLEVIATEMERGAEDSFRLAS